MSNNVTLTRSRIIKDPLWLAVDRYLQNRLEELNNDPSKREEYLLSLQRYHGLTINDVTLEPIAVISPTRKLVCMATRETGFARVDLEIDLVSFDEVISEYFLTTSKYPGFDEVIEEFRQTQDNRVVLNEETGKYTFFLKGEDMVAEINQLVNGVYFDNITITPVEIPEGTIPNDFVSHKVTFTDEAVAHTETTIDLLVHAVADDWVTHRVFGLRPVHPGQVLQLKEGRGANRGGYVEFYLDGYDPEIHTFPRIYTGNLTDETDDVEEFFWPADLNLDREVLGMTFEAYFNAEQKRPDFGINFRVQCDLKDGSGFAQSNRVYVMVNPVYANDRFELREITAKETVGYASGFGIQGKLHDTFRDVVGAPWRVFDKAVSEGGVQVPHTPFKDVVTPDNNLYFITGAFVTTGSDYHVTVQNKSRSTEFDLNWSLPDEMKLEQTGAIYTGGKVRGYYSCRMKYAGPFAPETITVTDRVRVYDGEEIVPTPAGQIELILTPQPVPVNTTERSTWKVNVENAPLWNYPSVTGSVDGFVVIKGDESSMGWEPGGDNEMDWDDEVIIIIGTPVDKDGNKLPGPFEFLPPIHNAENIDPDRPIIVENNPDGSFTIKVPVLVPDEGGNIKGDIVVVGPDDKTVEVGVDETVPPKPTFRIFHVSGKWNQDTVNPKMILDYQLEWPVGSIPRPAEVVVPFTTATNTIHGTLNPDSQNYDGQKYFGTVTFPINLDLYREMTYIFESGIKAGGVTLPVKWEIVIPATAGFYMVDKELSLISDRFIVTKQVFGPNGHPAGMSIQSINLAVVGSNPTTSFDPIKYNPADGMMTLSIPTIRRPANSYDGTLDFRVAVSGAPVILAGQDKIFANPIKVTVGESRTGVGEVITKMTAIDQISNLPMTGPVKVFFRSISHQTAGQTPTAVELTPGEYEVHIPVNTPADDILDYSFQLDPAWDIGGKWVSAIMDYSYSMATPWPPGNGTVTYVPEKSSVVWTGQMVGTTPVGLATAVVRVRLPDGTIPILAKWKRPMANLGYQSVGANGANIPESEAWDPVTGEIKITWLSYMDFSSDRTHVFSGNVQFFGYVGGRHDVTATNWVTAPKRPTLTATQIGYNTNAARNETTVQYQIGVDAPPPEGGSWYPLAVTMKKPFDRCVPSNVVVGYSPIRENYDPATGIGDFTFTIAPKSDAEVTLGLDTLFSINGLNPVTGKFAPIVPADTSFKATFISATLNGSETTLKWKLATTSGTTFPATATFTELTNAVGVLNGNKVPKSKSYNPANGEMTIVLDLELSGTMTHIAYRITADVLVTGGYTVALDMNVPTRAYVILNNGTSIDGVDWRTTYQYRMTGGEFVTAGRYVDVVANKPRPSTSPYWNQDTPKTTWYFYIPVTTPSTTEATQYTATGTFILKTPEGFELPLAFSQSYTKFLSPYSSITTALHDMVLNGEELTVRLKSTFVNSTFPAGSRLKVPFDIAQETKGGTKTPTSQSYDRTTGLTTFKIDVNPPTPSAEKRYTFEGWAEFPDYGDNVSQAMPVAKFNVYKDFVDPNAAFRATHQSTELKDNILTYVYKLDNPLGNFPASVSLTTLTSQIGMLNDSLSIRSSNYEPTTGMFTFTLNAKPIGLRTTQNYRAIGNFTVNGSANVAFDKLVTGHSYTLNNAGTVWKADALEVKHALIRTSDDTAINTASHVITTMPKLKAGSKQFVQHGGNEVNWVVTYVVDLPAASGTTQYDGSGYLMVTQASDGLRHYVPWTLSYTSNPIPAPGDRKAELWDITWTANSVTFKVLCKNADGSYPATLQAITPVYRTYTPAVTWGNPPNVHVYDPLTGILTMTFSGVAPDALMRDYWLECQFKYTDVTPNVDIPMAVYTRPLNNQSPNGIRP